MAIAHENQAEMQACLGGPERGRPRDNHRRARDRHATAAVTGPGHLRRWMTVMAIGAVLCATPVAAQRMPPVHKSLAELAADVARATQKYRDAVARSIPVHEAQVQEAVDALEERRQLHKAGVLSAAYVEQAERDLVTAQRDLEDARVAIEEADRILVEASLQGRLAPLAPLPRGAYEDVATLVRFNGTSPWSLKDVPTLKRRFADAFGRALPISAFGQTKVHDRLGLDHRTAIDVAVHPDSAEGRWLMQYLRQAGFPFIGVRAEVSGSSTGAHIHVGAASPRMLTRGTGTVR
jgi:hypothetical protein